VDSRGIIAATSAPSRYQPSTVATAKEWRTSWLCRRRHNHDPRHTHATILLRKRVPVKAVSMRLGHASPVVTMTVYAGWMPADDADAAAVFASASAGSAR
jgi:integrase